ncbi:hypothetical protein BDV98DRAFT_383179 [Pterulicium gracile]|uniref:Ribosomal protein L10-domain-containing protein n=1 Tax=Pterulicium gracile TaxID=1884261 RepID=A0A5C3QNJ8_9AGAR|nr:hypothetical protein BDV98DRAFT_383179 [Pterula gracilis]
MLPAPLLRPLRTQCLRRTYAISVAEPKQHPDKRLPRTFSADKQYHYNICTRLLASSLSTPLVFLQHTDFSAPRMIKLRRDITDAARNHTKRQRAMAGLPPLTPTSPEMQDAENQDPTLRAIRTGILGAALRDFEGVDKPSIERMTSSLRGPIAILSLPTFNPPQLSAILRTLEKTVPPKPPKTPDQLKKELDLKNADPATPGRRMKRVREERTPELKVVGVVVEGRVFLKEGGGVREVAGLETLGTLRAQIVGMLSAPAGQLAALLGEASGGRVARTLDGFRKSLEEAQEEEGKKDVEA